MLFFVELNKANEVKFWLTIYSYFDVSMIMVIIIKKNKYTLSRKKKIIFLDNDDHDRNKNKLLTKTSLRLFYSIKIFCINNLFLLK
jgi:hypothetical protein